MDEVSTIIQKRAKGAFSGLCIVVLVIIVTAYTDKTISLALIAVFGFVFFLAIAALYTVNVMNYPTPKAYYRGFNRWFYGRGAKFSMVSNAYGSASAAKRFANPLEAMSHPDSKAADLLETIVDAAQTNQMAKQVSSAEIVDQYFQQLATQKQLTTQGAPLAQNPNSATPSSSADTDKDNQGAPPTTT